MKEAMNLTGQGRSDPWSLGKPFDACQLDRVDRMEMGQELFHAFGTETRNIGEA